MREQNRQILVLLTISTAIVAVLFIGSLQKQNIQRYNAAAREAILQFLPQTTDVTIGSGVALRRGNRALVHYTARLENNTVFDSTRQRGQPLEVVVGSNAVVGGWDSGLAGMRIGGKRTITLPAARVKTSGLPFSSALTIEVDLLAVKQ